MGLHGCNGMCTTGDLHYAQKRFENELREFWQDDEIAELLLPLAKKEAEMWAGIVEDLENLT